MLVNPQEFNYRLTLGVLAVVIVVFTTYGLVSYSDLKSDYNFLVQEKRDLHNDLSEIINRYDKLHFENINLKHQLDSAVYKFGVTSKTIENLEAKTVSNTNLRNQLNFLRAQKRSLEDREDSLIGVAQKIESEKQDLSNELNFQKEKALLEKETFESKIEEASVISANSFVAKAYKTKGLNKDIQTFKAKDAEKIQLSFVVAKNIISPKGNKDLYIQIIDPNNNIISDKGSISFKNQTLIYSHKESINYNNSDLDICVNIKNNEAFKAGLYYINVFENNRRLGGTQMKLE